MALHVFEQCNLFKKPFLRSILSLASVVVVAAKGAEMKTAEAASDKLNALKHSTSRQCSPYRARARSKVGSKLTVV